MGPRLINWILFILLCFIWGSSFILMKGSRAALNAIEIASLRIFSAGLVLLPFGIYFIRRIPRNRIWLVLATGVFGNLIPAYLFAFAIMKIDSSLTGILNSLTPICVVIIGLLVFKDKIAKEKWLGVLVGFAGLCLLTFSQRNISLENLGYAGLVIIGTLSYGFNINLVGHYLKGINPLHAASVSLAFLVVPTGLVLWQHDFFLLDFSTNTVQWSVLNAVVLGVVGSAIATAIFYMLVIRAGGLFASLVTYGIPFVAIFWGLRDGEAITWLQVLGLCIILVGVYLAGRKVSR